MIKKERFESSMSANSDTEAKKMNKNKKQPSFNRNVTDREKKTKRTKKG